MAGGASLLVGAGLGWGRRRAAGHAPPPVRNAKTVARKWQGHQARTRADGLWPDLNARAIQTRPGRSDRGIGFAAAKHAKTNVAANPRAQGVKVISAAEGSRSLQVDETGATD